MRRFTSLIAAAGMLALLSLSAMPAQAHTYYVISGFQIVNGGYVATPVATTGVPDYTAGTPLDPQATDGTEVWTNGDPVAHTLKGHCVSGCSGNFTVTIAAGGQNQVCGLAFGTWEYSDTTYTWMKGAFKVNSHGEDSGCDNGLPVPWPVG